MSNACNSSTAIGDTLAAAVIMLGYDSGAIQRSESDEVFLSSVAWRLSLTFSVQLLEEVDAELATMTHSNFENLCSKRCVSRLPVSNNVSAVLNTAIEMMQPTGGRHGQA